MKATDNFRFGMIGAGNIGRVHMNTLGQLPEAEIVAVTDVFAPVAQSAAAEFHIPTVHETAENLINDPSIDAVVIGVPNKWHASLAVQALRSGKHVMLEKPMAIDVESAKEIVRAQRASGKVLMIPHQMRWEPIPMQVKEQMEKGALGDIYYAKAGWFRRKGIPGWGTWFTRKEESGGGPLIDIGVHLLDLSLHLMGNPKPVSVSGSTYAEFGPKKKGIGTWGTPDWNGRYDVEDLAAAIIKMENGSTLNLEVSWAVHMDTDSEPFIHLMGSEGGASVQGNKGKLLFEQFDRALEIELTPPAGDEGARIRLHRHFIECIREGKQPITPVMSGFTNNLILEAIYESSRTGREVTLDWTI
ncbi:Inositol 2-dehydrogenase/D-chiro-inositol 3-dehydrogenase [Paenibacillus solanacearum]|uniref:Inositol 2-dehydrogenase/D-chiro-inositol 3-dehydrogenase n=1 Tax=Paenibacillus solanacearum TaxID=2048548 RepID=A0A916JXN8_9BACL|nr:Gfo/Idh/MocA family oxidoreductase [Paenibacillus solanacearum]CAG7610570.1 Inositol 2-dehydrogenase/D-chiro-inositol 3-dehydrogenase [Paenibacillus solanacearum]